MKNNQPIDLDKLADQTLEDFAAFKGEGLDKQILVMVLYSVYQAGRQQGLNHGWHEEQDKQSIDLGGC